MPWFYCTDVFPLLSLSSAWSKNPPFSFATAVLTSKDMQVNSSPVPSSVPVNLHAGERVMTHPPYSENVAQSQDRGSAYVQPQHNGTAQKQRKLDIHMRNKKVLGPLSGRQTVNRPHTKTSPIDYSPQNGLQKPRLAESRQTWNVPSPQSVNQGTLPKTPKNLDHAAVQGKFLFNVGWAIWAWSNFIWFGFIHLASQHSNDNRAPADAVEHKLCHCILFSELTI